jgi:aquaporin Z
MKYQKPLAEAIGTFFLVFCGTGAIVVDSLYPGTLGHLGVCLTFGLVVLAMIYTIGHISGAHINPAVTLGFYAAGRMPMAEAVPYIGAQFAGATAASLALKTVFAGAATYGATLPAGPAWQSFALEFLLTTMLMFVIMGVATGAHEEGVMAGVAIGGTIALEALFGGPISGASMNPARSFGPALVSGAWHHHWIYWAAPALGALTGVAAYKAIRCDPEDNAGTGCC